MVQMTFYAIKNIQCIFRKPILWKLVRPGGITHFLVSRGRANNLHICILEIKASYISVSKVFRRVHLTGKRDFKYVTPNKTPTQKW